MLFLLLFFEKDLKDYITQYKEKNDIARLTSLKKDMIKAEWQENEYIHFFQKFYSVTKGIIDELHFNDGIMLRAPTKDGSIAYICASQLGENDRVTSGQVQAPQIPEMELIK